MSDYVLQVRLGERDEPIRFELHGYTADDAEVARQELATEIEHALEIEAPLMYSRHDSGVAIDPTRVTSVDLLAPEPE